MCNERNVLAALMACVLLTACADTAATNTASIAPSETMKFVYKDTLADKQLKWCNSRDQAIKKGEKPGGATTHEQKLADDAKCAVARNLT
jgi:outer membrane biogenesis lipoprotein LolB